MLPQTSLLQLDNITVRYAKKTVVHDLSLQLNAGEIACILGASGCGKTTVLRAIAGFEPITSGSIQLAGQVLSNAKLTQSAETRNVGMVFQDFALFPHLTVAQNVGFGLRGKLSKSAQQARVTEMLSLASLDNLAGRYPHELSGGQQQRVALARALATRPTLLLLDEPFSNLDADLRESLGQDVRALLKATHTTALMVTHDQHEAFAMADQIGIMRDGKLEQWDDAYNLYHRPATRYVADFIGHGVLVRGQVHGQNLDLEIGQVPLNHLPANEQIIYVEGQTIEILLRADDVLHDDASPLQAQVLRKAFRGAEFLYTLKLRSGQEVLALVPSHHNHEIGEKIGVRLELDHVIMFDADSPKISRASD